MTRLATTVPVRRAISLLAALIVGAMLAIPNSARAQGNVRLLTDQVGWQVWSGHLYWTTDGGTHWADISPPIPRLVDGSQGEVEVQDLKSVSFLNTEEGWALYSRPGAAGPHFKLAHTKDGGSDWTVWPLHLPPLKSPLAPGAQIAFADSLHGWMEAQPPHGPADRPGVLLMTSDGGQTWTFAPTIPESPRPGHSGVGGSILVENPQEVWLAGGVDSQYLYVTRDGAKSWQKITLAAPPSTYPAALSTYDLPIFKNEKDGYEAVTYAAPNFGRSAAVLFVTRDGGVTWRPDRIVTDLTAASRGQSVTSTVVDGQWILAFLPTISRQIQTSPPLLLKVGPGERIKAPADTASANFGWGLSFVSPMVGLAVGGAGPVMTSDGGATWKRASPWPGLPYHLVSPSPHPTEIPAHQ